MKTCEPIRKCIICGFEAKTRTFVKHLLESHKLNKTEYRKVWCDKTKTEWPKCCCGENVLYNFKYDCFGKSCCFSHINLGKKLSEGTKKKKSRKMKDIWSTKEGRENMIKNNGKPIKHTLNEKSFDNFNDEQVAYWIGYIVGDGCVRKQDNGISLCSIDYEHIEKFKKFLSSSHPISKTHKYESKHKFLENSKERIIKSSHNCYYIKVNSKYMKNKLIEYGIPPLKTYTAKPPELFKNNRHFWRGMIDSDGSIGIYNKDYRIEINGTKEICEGFKSYAENILRIQPSEKCVHPHGTIFRATFSCSKAKKVIDYLYSNSYVYLERKKRIVDDILGINVSSSIPQ